jgi:hypothetical protein
MPQVKLLSLLLFMTFERTNLDMYIFSHVEVDVFGSIVLNVNPENKTHALIFPLCSDSNSNGISLIHH